MPELPEVETLARGLRNVVIGKTISDIVVTDVLDKKTFKASQKQIKNHVIDASITAIDRRAKWLIMQLSSEHSFIVHLKMTGQLLYQDNAGPHFLGGHSMSGGTRKKGDPPLDIPADASKYAEPPRYPEKHTRVYFTFTDGSQLFYQDQRKFGYVHLYSNSDVEEYFVAKKLGLEPMDPGYTLEYFTNQLQRRSRTTIKAAILDQTVIAGIGNIYADDSLFTARIMPDRRVNSLSPAELKALHKATQQVITQAIAAGGTSFSDFYQLDGSLGQYWKDRKVYQRTGETCPRCKNTVIQKTKVAGRGTHFCPNCQK